MSANTDNQGVAPDPQMTVGAALLLEDAGLLSSNAYLVAQAQVALDKEVALDDVLDNPKEHADMVGRLLNAAPALLETAPTETADGMDFGLYTLRYPTGRDVVIAERGLTFASIVGCFALCSGLSLGEVKAMPLPSYYPGRDWLWEELGASAWIPQV